jgi:hypothetical protein
MGSLRQRGRIWWIRYSVIGRPFEESSGLTRVMALPARYQRARPRPLWGNLGWAFSLRGCAA